jgi:hypothetical protein
MYLQYVACYTDGHPRTICSRLASKQHRITVWLVESCVLTANFARAPSVQNHKCTACTLGEQLFKLKNNSTDFCTVL